MRIEEFRSGYSPPMNATPALDLRTLRSLLSSSGSYLGVLDSDGRWVDVNHDRVRGWGVAGESLIGHHFWESPWWRGDDKARERAIAAFRDLGERDSGTQVSRTDAMLAGELAIICLTRPDDDSSRSLTLVEVSTGSSEQYAMERLSALLNSSGIGGAQADTGEWSAILSRIVLANFPNGVVALFDHDMRYLVVEGTGLSAVGLTQDMLVGRTIREAWPPELVAAIEPQYRSVLAGSETPLDVTYQNSVFSTLGVPVRDESGRVIAGLLLTQDVTERRKAHEERRLSESRYRMLFEQHPSPMWIFDTDSLRILAVNNAAIEHYGWSRDEFLSMTIRDVRPPEDVPYLMRVLSSPSEIWNVVPGIVRHTRKDGTMLEVEVTSHALKWEGRPARLVLINDITEHARARAEQARLAKIIETSDDAIVSMDADATIVTWNSGARRMLGYSRSEMVGRSMLELVPEERRTEESGLLARAYAGETVSHFESERLHRDGSRIPVAIALSALPDAAGGTVGVSAIIRDMSTRRVLEEQLRQAQRMEAVGRLAGGIAHDFNNLLTAIEGHTGFILDDLPADHPSRTDAEEIRSAVKRASSLTRQLLAFGRKQVMQLRVVNAAAVVNDVQRLLRRVIGEDIELVTRSSGDTNVRADPGQLEQVMLNLAVNARDAMPEGGVLLVDTRVVPAAQVAAHVTLPPDRDWNEMVLISVADTGIGMDRATMARAFEPFFTTKPSGKGTGLGLAMVYGIITQSGGTVWLDSSPGRGTTVCVALPAVPEPATPSQDRRETPARPIPVESSGITLLIVEDEPAVRATLRRLLVNNGYGVMEAANGVEALNVWHNARSLGTSISGMITDVVMPGMGGRELAQVIRADQPTLPIMFTSGYVAEHILPILTAEIQADPRMCFVPKPFRSQEVLAALRQLLELSGRGNRD